MIRWRAAAAPIFIALPPAGHEPRAQLPDRVNFTAAINEYLTQRDRLCLAKGGKYCVRMPVAVASATRRVTYPGDFRIARLTLDRVSGWEAPQPFRGRMATSVLFSYRIYAASWTRTQEARRAFPLATRAIDGAGVLQLRLGVHLEPKGRVADELSG